MSASASASEREGGPKLEDARALIEVLLGDFDGEKIPSERLGQHLKDLVRLSRMLANRPDILAAIQGDPQSAHDLKRLMIKTGTLPPEPETLP